jgi:hypothetical protein
MSKSDWAKDAILALVRAALPLIDYYKFYRATVVSQSGDGRLLDLRPEDPLVPGHQKVPLRLGLPGARVKFNPGAKVLLGWEGGDPKQPVAAMFAGDEGVTSISITVEKMEIGGEDLLDLLNHVVIGKTPCQFTGAPHHVVGQLSTVLKAKG